MSAPSTLHLGKKVERIRKIKGIKQETLAEQLGMTRQSLSKLEQSEVIEDKKLELIAQALGTTAEDIKHFNEEALIQNNIYDQHNTVINYNFNPIEKIVQLYDELLKAEREKVALLESMVKEARK